MHSVEKSVLENEPNIGAGDASKCLPSWIEYFCWWFEEGNGKLLDHATVTALAHTLIAARVRAERLVKERDEIKKLFLELAEHAEYCGYGDSYERSGAKESGLIQRVNEMVEFIKGKL